MINAKEAKELYKQSDAEVKAYLAKIDPLIRKAAMDGEQFVALYIDGLWETAQCQPIMTTIQRRLKEELESLGFVVTHRNNGGGYIPPNGHVCYDYVLVVGW